MEHRTRTLAQTEQCSVLQCTCGMLHVTVGGTTVRMRAPTAEQLRDALSSALKQVEAASRPALQLAPRGDDLPS